MDLGWTLIEYRPGRYAKVSRTGKFLGTATEAEVRAWFASSPRSSDDEAPERRRGPSAPPPAPEGPLPGFLEAVDAPEEPEVPWEQPLIWSPTRPAPKPETEHTAPAPRQAGGDASAPESRPGKSEDARHESDESWAKPVLWAPTRPETKSATKGDETEPLEPDASAIAREQSNYETEDTPQEPDDSWAKPMLWAPTRPAPKPDAAHPATKDPGTGTAMPQPGARLAARMRSADDKDPWAKPMLWGRPPASKNEQEASPATIEPDTSASLASSPEGAQPDTEQDTHPSGGEKAVEAGAEPAGESQPVPDSIDSTDEAETLSHEAEVVAEQVDAHPTLVQVAMDLNNLEAIASSAQEPEPEPEPSTAGEAVNILEAMVHPSVGTETEAMTAAARAPAAEPAAMEVEREAAAPEAMESCPKEPGPDPDSIEQEPEPSAPEPDLREPPDTSPEVDEELLEVAAAPAAEAGPQVTEAESEALDEPAPTHITAEFASRESEATAPELGTPGPHLDAPEDGQEEETVDEEAGAMVLDAEEDEPEPELEVFAPPPASPHSSAAAAPSHRAGAEDLEQNEREPEPAAEDLWLWVDPRYEGGYHPATFDLSAFLQRAIALFQSKPWTGGHPPGRIAVHADAATDDFESIAERLELTDIEAPRVSNGTYWLGLGSDGQPKD